MAPIACELLTQARSTLTNGSLAIYVARSGKETMFKAVLSVAGETDRNGRINRYFGTNHASAVGSARNLLSRITDRVSDEERTRVLEVVRDVHGPRVHVLGLPTGSHCVSLVHQVYGVFRDDKPMPRLFENSLQRWREVAQHMGAQHHLWSADELDALIKQKYPQIWPTYRSVAFLVMRADIGRIAILHSYGGLYADLDVYPNRNAYAPASLTVQKVFNNNHRTAMKKWLPAKDKHSGKLKSKGVEMEVLVGSQGNPVFLRWLDYICEQIADKDYANSEHWQREKMRYIWHTTGPLCMARFLRLPENAEVWRNIKFLTCNYFKQARDMSMHAKRVYDVLSFQSNSYFDETTAYRSPVGDGEGVVPVFQGSQPSVRLRRRFNNKREVREMDIVNQCAQTEETVNIRRRFKTKRKVCEMDLVNHCAQSQGHEEGQTSARDACTGSQPREREESKTYETSRIGQRTQTEEKGRRHTYTQTFEKRTGNDKETQTTSGEYYSSLQVCELRRHIQSMRKAVSTEVFLQDMPKHLRTFFAGPQAEK